MRAASAVALLVSLAAVAAPGPAAAQHRGAAEQLSDAEVTRRLRYLQESFDRGTKAADRWWYAWASIYGGLALTEATIALATTNPDLRKDTAVGAVASSLGLIPLGVLPLRARFTAAELRALEEATPEERRVKLARGEHLLEEAARGEALGRSWMNHLLGGGVSLGVGLLLWLGYDRPVTGAVSFAGGVALCELQILTLPTAAIEDHDAYQRDGSALRLSVAPLPGGLAVGGAF